MEVLNSTDVIGDEIKEEARRKALQILKEADNEIEKLKREASVRLAKLKQEQTQIYNKKIEKYKSSAFITLPLEKWKRKLLYVENTLNNFLHKYFDELNIDKKLYIIKNELARFTFLNFRQNLIIKYCGFEKERIKTLVNSILPNCSIKEIREATLDEMSLINVFEGIIIEDESATFICKVGIEQAKEAMLTQIKEKIAKILFGELLN